MTDYGDAYWAAISTHDAKNGHCVAPISTPSTVLPDDRTVLAPAEPTGQTPERETARAHRVEDHNEPMNNSTDSVEENEDDLVIVLSDSNDSDDSDDESMKMG